MNLYLTWLASCQYADDLGERLKADELSSLKGFTFKDEAYIILQASGMFLVVIDNKQKKTPWLFEAIDFLWINHSCMSHG